MSSGLNCFLVVLCPVLSITNLQLPCNSIVGPMYIDICDFSAKVLVVGASSYVSAYVPNSTLQCLEYSILQSGMMVLGDYVCDIHFSFLIG